MSALAYKKLALEWQPAGKRDRAFHALAATTLLVVIVLAVILSLVPVPEEERRQRAAVPDRIAKFISEKPKPPPPVERPEPKPEPKPPPEPEPRPTVERERPREAERKPLTEAQKTAREKAENSGLLALRNEMSDLMDTSDVSSMVSGGVSSDSASTDLVAGHDASEITAGAAQGGGGVDSDRYGSRVGATTLTDREVAAVNSDLFAGSDDEDTVADSSKNQRSGNGRAREDVTIIFDRNKGGLYALYERERRKTPGLQGKIVLEITIDPSGEVTDVKVVSSELDSPSLESRIVTRIKMFKFEPNDVDEVTVTYPIEFLPS